MSDEEMITRPIKHTGDILTCPATSCVIGRVVCVIFVAISIVIVCVAASMPLWMK